MHDDPRYQEYLRADPGVSYSKWVMDPLADSLRKGIAHPTLGRNIGHDDWWEAGRPMFRQIRQELGIEPHHRVIEYGCGTLRIAAHFIDFLDRGNFMGLDVAEGLLNMGRELVGTDVLRDKGAVLMEINEGALAEAENFGADFIYSAFVAYHVHPAEKMDYLSSVVQIAGKAGCRVWMNTVEDEECRQFSYRCFSYSLPVYQVGLQPLALRKQRRKEAGGIRRLTMIFERVPAAKS